MVAQFETGQVRLCAAGDSYYDNFVSFEDFLGFAKRLKKALEEQEITERPITDSIINIGQLGQAQVHIDEAISMLEAQHNLGINEGATKLLRHVYDWLDCTIKVLETL